VFASFDALRLLWNLHWCWFISTAPHRAEPIDQHETKFHRSLSAYKRLKPQLTQNPTSPQAPATIPPAGVVQFPEQSGLLVQHPLNSLNIWIEIRGEQADHQVSGFGEIAGPAAAPSDLCDCECGRVDVAADLGEPATVSTVSFAVASG